MGQQCCCFLIPYGVAFGVQWCCSKCRFLQTVWHRGSFKQLNVIPAATWTKRDTSPCLWDSLTVHPSCPPVTSRCSQRLSPGTWCRDGVRSSSFRGQSVGDWWWTRWQGTNFIQTFHLSPALVILPMLRIHSSNHSHDELWCCRGPPVSVTDIVTGCLHLAIARSATVLLLLVTVPKFSPFHLTCVPFHHLWQS